MKMQLHPKLTAFVHLLDFNTIPTARKEDISKITAYVQNKLQQQITPVLNFVCTHNSRRSQFSQIWAYTAAHYYQIPLVSYSSGVEVTAFNPRAIHCLKSIGFDFSLTEENSTNPHYFTTCAPGVNPLEMFSKVYDDPFHTATPFAAIMTCDHADENCPFIPTADARLPLRFEDPKAFDDSPEEAEKYTERSIQIATEIFYCLSLLKN